MLISIKSGIEGSYKIGFRDLIFVKLAKFTNGVYIVFLDVSKISKSIQLKSCSPRSSNTS